MSKRNNLSAADAGSKKSKKTDSNPATDRILAMPNEDILPFLLAPISVETFFSQHWERAPLHIKRNDPTYFDGIFSKAILDRCLRERPLEYKFNINVCQCIDGVKVDQNGDTEAPVDPEYIHARYKAGSTLQALHPQQYTPAVWKINSALEDTFGALVGANCYLTPPGSQGLAPHCDDIEAFILQLEGSKRWRLYRPLTDLPRAHSGDLAYSDIGAPFMEIVLQPGDLLFFPRGLIHEACTQVSEGSTHLTISTYQKTAWVDFMQSTLQKACERAAADDVEFRRGLPLQYLYFLGTGIENTTENSLSQASSQSNQPLLTGSTYFNDRNADRRSKLQAEFKTQFFTLLDKLRDHVDIHDGADVASADFMTNRLPPLATAAAAAAAAASTEEPTLESRVRLLNPAALRMMIDQDEDEADGSKCVFLALSTENAREYHMDGRFARAPQLMKLPLACSTAVAALFAAYPKYVTVESLNVSKAQDDEEEEEEEEEDMRLQLIGALLEAKAIEFEK